ncbi:serine/threonine-protein kinase SBK1-like, partial [Tropilaelaps mercedesae]
VKLTDFGLTRRAGTLVKKRARSLPTCPPEIWEMLSMEGYSVETGSDGWQVGMLVFIGLTARFPWEKADITDPHFNEFMDWQKRKTTRTPKEFKRFSPRLLRLFRRLLEQKPKNRYEVSEVNKYYDDRWLMNRSPRTSKVAEMYDSSMQTSGHSGLSSGTSAATAAGGNTRLLSPHDASGGGSHSRKNSWTNKSREATPSPIN